MKHCSDSIMHYAVIGPIIANKEMGKQDNKAAASINRKNNSSSIHWD